MRLPFIWFSLRRMTRSFIAIILLIIVPIALISVLGLVSGYISHSEHGRPPMDWLAVSFVLSFQLFGGAYTISYLKEDLLSPRKWRIYSLPIQVDTYSYSIVIASTIFNMLFGLFNILFTSFVYGVQWGNLFWVLVVLLAISLLTQIVCFIFVLAFRSSKLAERMSEVYGIGSMIFAGMMFNLPEGSFFNFMSTYGNPVSLGQNAIFGMIDGADLSFILLSIGLLFGASLLLLPVAHLLGKRRLS